MSASRSSVSEEIIRKWEIDDPSYEQVESSSNKVATNISVPMWSFAVDGVRISCDKAVRVEFAEENDSFFASCDRLHVFSNGASYGECIRDFNRQVIHFYGEYTSLESDEVAGLAVQLRDLYLKHFSAK